MNAEEISMSDWNVKNMLVVTGIAAGVFVIGMIVHQSVVQPTIEKKKAKKLAASVANK